MKPLVTDPVSEARGCFWTGPQRQEKSINSYSLSGSLVGCSLEVVFWCDCLYPSKVVQNPHLGDVHLGKEPVVVGGPVDHLRVATEQGFLGKGGLCTVNLSETYR